jgi:hypothetical protein
LYYYDEEVFQGQFRILGLHPISKVEIYPTVIFDPLRTFLPQSTKIAEEIEVRLNTSISFTEMDEGRDK